MAVPTAFHRCLKSYEKNGNFGGLNGSNILLSAIQYSITLHNFLHDCPLSGNAAVSTFYDRSFKIVMEEMGTVVL